MKFTITSDPVDQYNGRGIPGRYDAEFSRLTQKNNCIVFDKFSDMEKVAQAMDGWIKRANLTGAKVKTTKAYKSDGKPRCWLIFPPVPEKPKTEIRGNFPK